MRKAIWISILIFVLGCTITVFASTRIEQDAKAKRTVSPTPEAAVELAEPAKAIASTTSEPVPTPTVCPTPKEEPVISYDNLPMYVAGDYVQVRSAPSVESEIIDAHRLGDQVTVIEKRNGWYELAAGGYIRADLLASDRQGIVSRYLENYEDLVVVFISEQRVEYWHQDEMLTSGPCVSGDAYSSPTPIGEYVIGYKQTDFDMNNNPGTHVQYACFFNGGIAFHDAPWRSEFGGDIYTWGGSHGCINLQYDLAEFIYEHSQIDYTHVLVLP